MMTSAVWSLLAMGVVLADPLLLHLSFLDIPTRANTSALVLVANGTEDLEAVATIDLLRRGGMRVVVAGVDGAGPVTCKFGCVLTPDLSLDMAGEEGLYDVVVVPGGEQACDYMAQSELVGQVLSEHVEGERFIAATTAGPVVLDAHKINYLQRLTSAPEYKEKLSKHYTYKAWEETIVDVPGRMITGRFSGSVMEFALSIINHVAGKTTADTVSYSILPYSTYSKG